MTLSGDVDLKSLARATPGYVGADLTSLATTASTLAIRRCVEGLVRRDTTTSEQDPNMDHQLYADLPTSLRDKAMARFLVSHPNPLNEEQLSTLSVSSIDFTAALKIVQPSAKREGFATVPETTWADIGALSNVREELHMAIVRPASHPELFASMGMDSPSGVLLWGPPGCGKTLLAKAVANESRTNFISVKGPELLNKVCHNAVMMKLMSSTSERARKLYDKCSPGQEPRHHVLSSSMSSMPWCPVVMSLW